MGSDKDSLAQRLLAGDKRALARGISLVENDDPAGWELVREVYPHTGKAAVMGFTGPPGAGKSTLLAALTKLKRARDQTVAVLSIDPSSPDSSDIRIRSPRIAPPENTLEGSTARIPTVLPVRR